VHRSGSNATTGSATSDEDVLKGAYGGHITAGGDNPFPRDQLRTINDQEPFSPHNGVFHPNHHNANIVTPIDMRRHASDRGLGTDDERTDDEEEEEFYEDEEEYEDEEYEDEEDEEEEETDSDEEEEEDSSEEDSEEHDGRRRGGGRGGGGGGAGAAGRYGGGGGRDGGQRQHRQQPPRGGQQRRGNNQRGGGQQQQRGRQHPHGNRRSNGRAQHMTVGAPPDYPHNRHHVDADEQHIVNMMVEDELKKKVEDQLKQQEIQALQDKDSEYRRNIYAAHQEEQERLDDIINDMHYDVAQADDVGANYYHQ